MTHGESLPDCPPGYSTDWEWLMETARVSVKTALYKAQIDPYVNPELVLETILEMFKRGDFADTERAMYMMYEFGRIEIARQKNWKDCFWGMLIVAADKIGSYERTTWPGRTPYQLAPLASTKEATQPC